MNRVFGLSDTGNAFRRTDSAPVKVGGIYKTDDGQSTFTDGSGNKYWFVDTTAASVTITLPNATDTAADTVFTVKRTTGGVNTLTVQAGSGNIDGSATHSLPNQYDCFSYVSDGENYWIV